MGFMDAIAGRKKLMSFEVAMAPENCTCNFYDVDPLLTSSTERFAVEIIRLFACYQAFVIYGAGGPQSPNGRQALDWLVRLLQVPPDGSKTVFALLGSDYWPPGFDLVPAKSFSVRDGVPFCGHFYSRNKRERRIEFTTKFGPDNTPFLMSSALAVLEYGIRVCSSCDKGQDLLNLFAQTCRNLLMLYDHYDSLRATKVAPDVSRAMSIPDHAFFSAAGLER